MKLIDLDAFREEWDLRENCDNCKRNRNCDRDIRTVRDFCGWLDDAPTVDAIQIDKMAMFLADQKLWPNKPDCESCECYRATCDRVTCWEHVLRGLMEQEEANGTDNS